MLKGDVPNDLILQVFVEQLAEKVAQRKSQLRATMDRVQEQKKFEDSMAKSVREVRGDLIDKQALHKVFEFLKEQKPKIDLMEH